MAQGNYLTIELEKDIFAFCSLLVKIGEESVLDCPRVFSAVLNDFGFKTTSGLRFTPKIAYKYLDNIRTRYNKEMLLEEIVGESRDFGTPDQLLTDSRERVLQMIDSGFNNRW